MPRGGDPGARHREGGRGQFPAVRRRGSGTLSSLACVRPGRASARRYPSCGRSRRPRPLQASVGVARLESRVGIGGARVQGPRQQAWVRASSQQDEIRVVLLAGAASRPDQAPAPAAAGSLSFGALWSGPTAVGVTAVPEVRSAGLGPSAQRRVVRAQAAVRQPFRAVRRSHAGQVAHAIPGRRWPAAAILQAARWTWPARAWVARQAAMRPGLLLASCRRATRRCRAARADPQRQVAHCLRLKRRGQGASCAAPEEGGRRRVDRAAPPGFAPRTDRAAAVPWLQALPALPVATHCAVPVRRVYWGELQSATAGSVDRTWRAFRPPSSRGWRLAAGASAARQAPSG